MSNAVPRLYLELTRRIDGSVVFQVKREDGATDWQKQDGKYAAFFPLHDLTHYCVETELGITDAFYGLLASGWSISDTEGRSDRGPLPVSALFVEAVVGTLDSERASGSRWTAAEFNEGLAILMTRNGRVVPHQLTDDELARIRRRRAELFARWQALPAGETLRLEFPAPDRLSVM